MSTPTLSLPCAGHADLYDAVLFPDDGQTVDPDARGKAAALCGGCPAPCAQKVTGFATDRFKRVHELATHWYRGDWASVHHDTPRVPYSGPDKHARARHSRTPHTGSIGAHHYQDDGTRLARSVQRHPSVRGGLHPTEKPTALLAQLVAYACPPGGLVLDPFAGSGSTLDAARQSGRRAVGIEASERYAEAAARRLSAQVLSLDTA